MARISIIIRTFNEEYWIPFLIRALEKQTVSDFEIINVDNCSTDRSVDLLLNSKLDVKCATIDEYLPGKSLNIGCALASGRVLVFISAHCIPNDEKWLEELASPIEEGKFHAVYGRQIPCQLSHNKDKRDLFLTFPKESRVQNKDSFFHNANSAISRQIWLEHPFDNDATNIEDRLFGLELIERGLPIYYNSNAKVIHHHGLHQTGNEERLTGVVKILEREGLIEYETDFSSGSPTILKVTIVTERNRSYLDEMIFDGLDLIITNLDDLSYPHTDVHLTAISSRSKVISILGELKNRCYERGIDYIYYKAAESWSLDNYLIGEGVKMSNKVLAYSQKINSQLIRQKGTNKELVSDYGKNEIFEEVNIARGFMIHRSMLLKSPEVIFKEIRTISSVDKNSLLEL